MKKTIQIVFFAVFLLSIPFTANATPIDRNEFSPNAVEFDFSGFSAGTEVVSDGFMTVTNGGVSEFDFQGISLVSPTYADFINKVGIDIRIDFLNPVSAVGMDWLSFWQITTLEVYDSSDNLLESFSSAGTEVENGFTGFMGIDTGADLVSWATIGTPLESIDLYIDNIIYQRQQPVPEPSTMLLLAAGLIGLAGGARKKLKNSSSGVVSS